MTRSKPEQIVRQRRLGSLPREAFVENVISDLVGRFERGGLTRRELVQALALVAGAGIAVEAASLKAGSINHVSVLVADMARSMEFYNRVFGLTLVSEDKAHNISRLGTNGKVIVSLRLEPPAGRVDHFAIGVEGFNKDAVTRELQGMGLTPHENIEYGFYVNDPDGANVQITGI
jgi:catechol 2,3-dioxygenase-like lactoylglutathione lyase family enzyme